jgi:hypothetical protein
MKKVSTAGARETRNFRDQKLTIGLDLGDRWSWYCVLDERSSTASGEADQLQDDVIVPISWSA